MRKEEPQATSCPSLLLIWLHWGQRVPLSLPLLSKDGRRRLVCSLPLLLAQTGRCFSGDKATGLMQLQVLRSSVVGTCWGEGLLGGALNVASSPQELSEM